MNCECFKRIEKDLIDMPNGYKGKEVLDAKIVEKAFSFEENKPQLISLSTAELTIKGLKKPQRINIAHSFCPFCGTKI